MDQNARDTFAVPNREFDRTALLAAERGLQRADPSSSIALLDSTAASTASIEENLASNTARFAAPDWLAEALTKNGCTHLLLITRHRAQARIHTSRGSVGSGTLMGLGLYLDRALRTKRSDTGERAFGLIAPFAYFELTLIDVTNGRIVSQQNVTASRMISAARNTTNGDPWDTLTAEEKTRVLNEMLEREVPDAIASMIHP